VAEPSSEEDGYYERADVRERYRRVELSADEQRLLERYVADGARVLDVGTGAGRVAFALARHGHEVAGIDRSASMLEGARQTARELGLDVPFVQADAVALPFPDASFDDAIFACNGLGHLGLDGKVRALAEMARVTRPGGRVLVLEFSRVWKPLERAYDAYSFGILPRIGKYVARDEEAYRYLAESIRMHPDQETLKGMMEQAGLARVEYFNMTAGVVALHRGFRVA
jgi:demethylmenaquinone methyltransferase/2-methoxy-6-polyprenyl-1,4-benzoquinol methylase